MRQGNDRELIYSLESGTHVSRFNLTPKRLQESNVFDDMLPSSHLGCLVVYLECTHIS